MKREIKFRSWIDDEMYCNDDDIYKRLDDNGDFKPFMADLSDRYLDDHGTIVEDLTSMPNLMQFTGLKDKNGKEIYEGDIITYLDAIGKVYYNDDACMFMIRFPLNRLSLSFDSLDDVIKIVGNIHENPELL